MNPELLTPAEMTLLERIDTENEHFGVHLQQDREYFIPNPQQFIDTLENREKIDSTLREHSNRFANYIEHPKNHIFTRSNKGNYYHFKLCIPDSPWGMIQAQYINTPEYMDERIEIITKEMLLDQHMVPSLITTFKAEVHININRHKIIQRNFLSGTTEKLDRLQTETSHYPEEATELVDTTIRVIDFILNGANKNLNN